MNELDHDILTLLVRDARLPFADIARELGISRAHARNRVQALVESGVIEQFAAVVNPDKLGKAVSCFVDLRVRPAEIETMATEPAACPEVVSLYIMSDRQSLHIHTLTDTPEAFETFVRRRIFNRPEILSADCKTLPARVKHRRGGVRR